MMFFCVLCKSEIDQSKFATHLKKMHSICSSQCPVCLDTEYTVPSLRNHIRHKHLKIIQQCDSQNVTPDILLDDYDPGYVTTDILPDNCDPQYILMHENNMMPDLNHLPIHDLHNKPVKKVKNSIECNLQFLLLLRFKNTPI